MTEFLASIDELQRAYVLHGEEEIELPNWRKACFGAKFSTAILLDVVREAAGATANARAVIAFGSAVRRPRRTVRKFLCLWERVELETIDANDIDLMVFVGDQDKRVERQLSIRADDGFYSYYWKPLDCIHVAALTLDTFKQATEAGDSTALAIMQEGVLLVGESPVALADTRRMERKGSAWRVASASKETAT